MGQAKRTACAQKARSRPMTTPGESISLPAQEQSNRRGGRPGQRRYLPGSQMRPFACRRQFRNERAGSKRATGDSRQPDERSLGSRLMRWRNGHLSERLRQLIDFSRTRQRSGPPRQRGRSSAPFWSNRRRLCRPLSPEPEATILHTGAQDNHEDELVRTLTKWGAPTADAFARRIIYNARAINA